MVAGGDLENGGADAAARDKFTGERLQAVGGDERIAVGRSRLRGRVEEFVLGIEHVEQGPLAKD